MDIRGQEVIGVKLTVEKIEKEKEEEKEEKKDDCKSEMTKSFPS